MVVTKLGQSGMVASPGRETSEVSESRCGAPGSNADWRRGRRQYSRSGDRRYFPRQIHLLPVTILVLPLDQVAGDGFEAVGAAAVGLQGGESFFDEAGGVALALFEAVDGWPGGFFGGLILARGLAQVG